MNYKNSIKKFTILVAVLFQCVLISKAQTTNFAEPRQEKLLNGLKLLVWNAPNAEKVTVKLRIHSGSAFDPQGKEGVMALLADAMFPSAAQKEYFAEDLGGSLDVTSNFDYIQINATANSDQFLTLMETLANAITNTQIDKDITAKVVAARLEKVKELEKNPSYIADQAVVKRLFGNFPYGRAQMGTSESLAKIDYADLLFAKQRFLTADNATIAVVGNVKPDFAYSAARRYFGSWQKADKKVPATFRQPDAPDAKRLEFELPNSDKNLYRSAMTVAARNDKDFYATKILTEIWQNQFCLNGDSVYGNSTLEPHLLNGTYLISIKFSPTDAFSNPINSCVNARAARIQNDGKISYPEIKQKDFDQAKNRVAGELSQKSSSLNDLTDLWLDADTYKLLSVKDELQKANSVTLADVQRVADNLQKQPVASVVVRNTNETKK